MPWSASDAKKHKKGLTPAQSAKWASIANGVLKSCQASGGKDCEGKAIRIANSKFIELPDGKIFDIIQHDEHFGISEEERDSFAPKDKPGGSNAGKYKKGPFCGPSGGAPKGTYPVNTRKRAIAAIAYARHAPNPSGIKSCVCRHWPSLEACKKKSKQSEDGLMEEKLPKGALRFVDQGCHAITQFVEGEGEEKTPKLKITGYSGGIIKKHWYWGDLGIDLEGIQFKESKYPVLEDHDTRRKIAVMGKPVIEDGKLVAPDNVRFLRTPAAQEFIRDSEDGFPFQASIYAKPSVIERVPEGETVEVNGMKLKGPGTVFRKCEFKEVSVCVFGWDSRTQASAFSKDEFETVTFTEKQAGCSDCDDDLETADIKLIKRKKEVTTLMDLEELKKEHPDIYQQALDAGKSAALAEKESGDNKILAAIEKLNERIDGMEEGMTKLNESDTLRSEKELAGVADKVWNERLSKSEIIPVRLHSEIKTTVNHNKFIGEDGKFDREGFGEAVDAKISLWEENLKPEDEIMGSGMSEQDLDGNKADEVKEENNQMVLRLRKLAGEKIKEDE